MKIKIQLQIHLKTGDDAEIVENCRVQLFESNRQLLMLGPSDLIQQPRIARRHSRAPIGQPIGRVGRQLLLHLIHNVGPFLHFRVGRVPRAMPQQQRQPYQFIAGGDVLCILRFKK